MEVTAFNEKKLEEFFVKKDSIMRSIWGKADTILFIFAGSAAEFALNKAVDWLYFTGNLPTDPLARLFSTVRYAREIVFAKKDEALKAVDKITAIHSGVESMRGEAIPDWAYRDVLFMLIDYSIRAFELLERELTNEEKKEVFTVFNVIGNRMHLKDLPANIEEWVVMREGHLQQNLAAGQYTHDLFQQYKKHLGRMRYFILLEVQKMIVPAHVKRLLKLGNINLIGPVLGLYKFSRLLKLDWFLKSLILPAAYKEQVKALDQAIQK